MIATTFSRLGRTALALSCAAALVAVGVPTAAQAASPAPSQTATAAAVTAKPIVEPTPVLGWSSWSFLRLGVNANNISAEARAMANSPLRAAGYRYINMDDNWYQCPGQDGSEGPNVDANGRWLVNNTLFPSQGGVNGIQVLANYIHSLGLKFGIYETPGISEQAVARNTPVLGTDFTANEITNGKPANNYNCGGMLGLNFTSAGSQDYIDSTVSQLASWGVDYVKLDGITNKDTATITAWQTAIQRTHRPIVLNITQGSYTIKIASTLRQSANQWEFAPDIETSGPDEGSANACNVAPFTGCPDVFPLTNYAQWSDRFDAVAQWQPVGGPNGFNDYDSIEVGNGVADSGMSVAAEQSQLSLWALGSAPLILGGDLSNSITNDYGTHAGLTSSDLAMLTNRSVLAVDQDGIDASRVVNDGVAQVFTKREQNGADIVGLFNTGMNTSAAPTTITISAAQLGLGHQRSIVTDLWTGRQFLLAPGASLSRSVVPEGVSFLKVTPLN